jgi:hypothetical protein
MKTTEKPEHLFIGHGATGIIYADKTQEENRDYKTVALLFYDTLQLKFYPSCRLRDRFWILRHAATMEARKGEDMPITGSGQTVRLGGRTCT